MELLIRLVIALLILFVGKELIAAFGLAEPAPKIIWIVLIIVVILYVLGNGVFLR